MLITLILQVVFFLITKLNRKSALEKEDEQWFEIGIPIKW